jgi:hypothetical protein
MLSNDSIALHNQTGSNDRRSKRGLVCIERRVSLAFHLIHEYKYSAHDETKLTLVFDVKVVILSIIKLVKMDTRAG